MTTCAETDCPFRTFGGWCGLTACIRRNTTTEIGANPGCVIPEDYVKVVRCRDCKHWVCADTVGSIRYGDCTNGHSIISRHAMPNENYYCADGERRDSE